MSYVFCSHLGQRVVGELKNDRIHSLQNIGGPATDMSSEILTHAPRSSSTFSLSEVLLHAPVQDSTKIFCVGLNYVDHIEETGREFPSYPVLFPKFASNIIGPYDDILLPPESLMVDYECEMAIVIGKEGRRIREANAISHVLGYTVANDITMRDFQYKTHQWLQGKSWDNSTPIGPCIVPPEDIDLSKAGIRTRLNGKVMQESNLSQLLFSVPTLVATVSEFTLLRPGDLILSGTPGGVGYRRKPQVFLKDGDEIEVEIDGIGCLKNRARAETR